MNERSLFDELFSNTAVRVALVGVLAILALFLLIQTLNAAHNLGRSGSPYMNTITVEATGEASMVPDVAVISYSVVESAETVAEAQTLATEKANAALAFVREQGVAEKDIKTTGYTVYPKYEYPQPCRGDVCPAYTGEARIVGYEVSQSVEVKVRDTAKAGAMLQGLGTLEVQNISGPNFIVDEEDAVRAEAREQAIAEAREKARQLAQDLGVSLGKVVSFSENAGFYPMYEKTMAMGGAMDAAESAPMPELPTGENESSVTVMITYEIW